MKAGWKKIPFEKSIEKVKYTTKIATCDYCEEGVYPIISQESEYISGYWNNSEDVFKISKPVVIFGEHTRIFKYIDFDFVLGADGVKILQPIDDLNAKFFKFYLEFCNIPNLGYSRHYKLLKELEVPIPSDSEQEQIVAELDLISRIIEKKQQQLKELESLAQSLFYEMFGNPVENDKGWDVKIMEKVAPSKVYKGNVPCENGKYWLLNLDMISSNTGEIIQKCYYDLSEIGDSTKKFNSDNVLYSKLRPYLNKVVMPTEIGYATSELIPLCPDKNILNRTFITSLLRSSCFVNYISIKVAGAKMPRVSMGDFWEFPIILPPLPLQQEFASKIEKIEKQKELIKQSLQETETLFNSRMNFYFN